MNQALYGFHTLEDAFPEQAILREEAVNTAIVQALAEHNRQLDAMYSLFTTTITRAQLRFKAASGSRLQPLDELGRARPIRAAGEYTVGFPVQKAGVALGQTYEQRIKMSVGDVNDALANIETGDIVWMREHIMAALLYGESAPWIYDDDEFGELEVYGLANGDTTRYNVQAGASAGATDTHYLAYPEINNESEAFAEVYEELMEHPENSGEAVALVPTNLKAQIESLDNFHEAPDPNITPGLGDAQLTGTFGAAVPGQVIGYVDGVWICHWKQMPADYMIAVATGGERPIAQRNHPEPQLQGFVAEADREDYPYAERTYVRRAGFGAWNRIGAAVVQVGASEYSTPADFASPLA